jgi:hypothetical protein
VADRDPCPVDDEMGAAGREDAHRGPERAVGIGLPDPGRVDEVAGADVDLHAPELIEDPDAGSPTAVDDEPRDPSPRDRDPTHPDRRPDHRERVPSVILDPVVVDDAAPQTIPPQDGCELEGARAHQVVVAADPASRPEHVVHRQAGAVEEAVDDRRAVDREDERLEPDEVRRQVGQPCPFRQGLPDEATEGGNKGGTIEKEGVKITLTHAFHSSSSNTLEYLGEPAGLIVELEDGKKIYFAGDTCVFGDMQLIGRIYEPDLAVLPIGDHYTMGPKEAALALELLGVGRCVPCHYGTFPLLTGTPEACREAMTTDCEIAAIQPGETLEL